MGNHGIVFLNFCGNPGSDTQIPSKNFKKITGHEKMKSLTQLTQMPQCLTSGHFEAVYKNKIKMIRDESLPCLIRRRFTKAAQWF